MPIKTGATVRLIQPVLQGQIVERRINQTTDELELLVEWIEDGQPVRRWIDASCVEEVAS